MKNNLIDRYHKIKELDLSKFPNYEKIDYAYSDEEIKLFLFDNIYLKYLSLTQTKRMKREGYDTKTIREASNEEKIRLFDKYEKGIIPDSEEFIHRKDWMPLNTFQKVNDKWFDDKLFEEIHKTFFHNPKNWKGQALLYSKGNTLTKNKFLKSLGNLGFETLDAKR